MRVFILTTIAGIVFGASLAMIGCGTPQKILIENSAILQRVIDLPCEEVKQQAVLMKEKIDSKIKKR